MLRVGTAQDITVGIIAQEVGHVAANPGKVRDGAIVHKDVAAENERVAVNLRDDAAAGRADVGKEAVGLGVTAKIAEVEVADWWGLRLVKSGSTTLHVLYIVFGRLSVPCNPKAVHVEEAVAHFEESVFGIIELALFSVGKKSREVVFRALLRNSVGRIDEHVGEEAGLLG